MTLTLPTFAFAGAPEGQQPGEGEPQNDHRSGALQTKPIRSRRGRRRSPTSCDLLNRGAHGRHP